MVIVAPTRFGIPMSYVLLSGGSCDVKGRLSAEACLDCDSRVCRRTTPWLEGRAVELPELCQVLVFVWEEELGAGLAIGSDCGRDEFVLTMEDACL